VRASQRSGGTEKELRVKNNTGEERSSIKGKKRLNEKKTNVVYSEPEKGGRRVPDEARKPTSKKGLAKEPADKARDHTVKKTFLKKEPDAETTYGHSIRTSRNKRGHCIIEKKTI